VTDGRQNPPLIMVVDDEVINREMMQAYLESGGYRVALAHNGQKALELILVQRPDLILLDVRMPVMNGYEVCVRLKAREATRAIPVIMLTGMDSIDASTQAKAAGADDVLSKPFDGEALFSRIERLLGGP
jgi:putative two-component system response regulator